MQKIWVKILIVALMTFGMVIPTATTPTANAVGATRPNAIGGVYTAYSFANAITGVTGDGSAVTFTYTAQTGAGADWRTGDFITVTFPSSNTTTTAYNFGQAAVTAITANTITVSSTVKVDTTKYPNTVALTGLTSTSTGIRAGTLTVTRDPNSNSTPNGCSLGGTMTVADGPYDIPKYISLGQAINNGSTVKIAAGQESVDQGVYVSGNQFVKTVNGLEVTSLSVCKGAMYIPEGVKSLSSNGNQPGVTDIAFPSTMEVIQSSALNGYSGLVSLNLDPVKYLMTTAFISGCNITSLSLGDTFEFFGKQSLNCPFLTAVALPGSIRSLGEWTFGGSAVMYFDLPSSFTCTEPGLMQESGCDQKIGQYFFGGQSGQTILAPSIKINLGNIQSSSTKLALEHYLGVQTLRGTVTTTNDPNCTIVNSCKTTTFVPNASGNLLPDQFGRTGMGYNVGNFPSAVFTENSAEGAEQTFTQSITSGVTTQLSAVSVMSFSKSNNSFAGWNTAADGSGTTYVDTGSINTTSTLYLFAQWSPIYTYTVNLNPGTGGTGTQMTAMVGTAATVILNSNTYSRTGYTFNGWNTAEDGRGSSSYLNQGTVRLTVDNQTVTLYAQWLVITYTITYLPGPNGSSTSSAQTLNYGGSVTLKDASAGFTRTGYSIIGWTTSSASGAAKTNDLGSTYSTLAAITLYPVWGAGVYVITYDGQGATTAANGGSTTYTANAAITSIPTTAPLRSGYNFVGWFTASTGGTQVTNGSYTPSTPFGAITLYAQWSGTTQTVTYDANSATSGAPPASQSYTTGGTALTLRGNSGTLVRSGYTFAGWATAADGTGTSFTATQTGVTLTADTTLYAKWTANSNVVTYNSQGGSAVAAGSFTTASTLSLAAAPTRAGYTFAGWFAESTGGTALVSGYSPIETTGITLYAQWTANTYTISYNANSSSSGTAPSSQSYTSGGTSLTLDNNSGSLERAGYTFSGWNTLANGSGTNYAAGATSQTLSASITLFAKWTANSLNVTFDSQGGSIVTSSSFTTGATLTLPAGPTRTGYTFAGWFAAATGGTALTTGYSPANTSAFTLYAQWGGVANTVTFDSQGGSTVSAGSFTTGATLTLPAGPTRTGYTFAGWFAAATGGTALTTGYSPANTSAFTLYAQWSPNTYTVTYNANATTSGTLPPSQTYTTGGTALNLASITLNLSSPGGGIYLVDGVNNPVLNFTRGTRYIININAVGHPFYFQTSSLSYNPSLVYTSGVTGSGTSVGTIIFDVPQDAPSSLTFVCQNHSNMGNTISIGSSQSFTRPGYTFAGWNTASNGSGTSYSRFQSGVALLTDITLFAQWSANTYAVSYNGNSATSGSAPTSQSFTSGGTTLTLAGNSGSLAKAGFFFAGWNAASDGSGSDYAAGATNQSFVTDLVLWAKWTTSPTKTVVFKANGGLGSDASQSTNLSTNLITNTFTRSGYVFSNWNSLANGSGTSYANSATYTFVSDLTLFATWTEKTLRTLSFSTTTFAMRFGETLTVTSVLSIGTGTISYSAGSSTACSVNPISGLITITNGVGSCDVSATVTEDSTYRAVTTATPTSITVSLGTPVTPILGAITSVDGVLKVAFTQSDAIGNGISSYKYSIDGITFISLTGTASPLSIPGLIPGTYTLKIIAVNAYGESVPTAPVIVVVVAGPTVTVTTPGGGGGGGFVPSGPSASEIAAAQKAAVDKALADKAAADKLIADRLAVEKAIADKLAADRSAAEKLVLERLATDKAAAEKALADKLAADKAAADKAIADKLLADSSAAALNFMSTCNLGQGTTVVTPKSLTMKIYSQICFIPDLMKPMDADTAQLMRLAQQLKSKKITAITISSFADEKNGMNFKSIAQTRANVVATMIKKSNPKIKISFRLYGSSTKKNSLSLGRVVITA